MHGVTSTPWRWAVRRDEREVDGPRIGSAGGGGGGGMTGGGGGWSPVPVGG